MPQTPPTPPPARPTIQLRWKDWLPYLEDKTATEAQKKQVIETVWSIALAFVDLGWDFAPNPQISSETSGQSFDLTAVLQAAVLYSDKMQTPAKTDANEYQTKEEV